MPTPRRQHCIPLIAITALLLTAAAGCGEVRLVTSSHGNWDASGRDGAPLADGGTPTDAGQAHDGAQSDAAAMADTVTGDAATGDAVTGDGVGSDTAAPTDAGLDPTPPTFSGQATVAFAPHKSGPPGNLLIVTVKVAGGAMPKAGHTYVLWLDGAQAGSKNFGKLPMATDFSISSPPPPIGAKDPIALYNGARISYEVAAAVLGLKAPAGPIAWQGAVPPAVWQQVQHVLVKTPTGGKGYAQQAAMIMAEVESQLQIAANLLGKGDKLKARATVEIMHNLLAGPKEYYDLDKNKQVIQGVLDVQVGLPGAEGAVVQALKHAGLAVDKAPDNAALKSGLSALSECEKPLVEKATLAIELTAAFASGAQSSLSPTTKAVGLLRTQMDCLLAAAGQLPVIALQTTKP